MTNTHTLPTEAPATELDHTGITRRWTTTVSSALSGPFAPLAIAIVGIGVFTMFGIGDVAEAAHAFPWDIPAIFVALEIFTAMVIATGIGDVVAIKLATTSKGRPIATASLSVVVLLATCVLGNNLSHVGIVLPILLILLGTLAVDRRYLIAFFALVMAIVNLAGAATPVGDFPALTIMASGITSFSAYLALAFPTFAIVTSGALLLVYMLIMRRSRRRARTISTSGLPPHAGGVLLAARLGHVKLDTRSLVILALVLAGMFAGWVFLPTVPAWAVAWAGTAIAVVLTPKQIRRAVKIESVDLLPVLKISIFLGIASFVATTGVLEQIALLLQRIDDPVLLLITLMLTVTVITSVVSAGPTAAVLLPVAQGLVVPGATLAGMGDLVALAFAGAICAGSSMFLISATAGPLLSKKVRNSTLVDDTGAKLDFSFSSYLPYGILNTLVQLSVALMVVLLLLPFWSAR